MAGFIKIIISIWAKRVFLRLTFQKNMLYKNGGKIKTQIF